MSDSPDFLHSDSYSARRTPGWIVDLIEGGAEASAAFRAADATYRAAAQAAMFAELPVGEEQKKLRLSLAGASNAALDAAVAERDRTAAELASAKRERETARRALVRLIEDKSPEAEALISRTAGENVITAREDAARALDVLTSAFRRIDEYVRHADGLVTYVDTDEVRLLFATREAGLSPDATLRAFSDRGLGTPPGYGRRDDWFTAAPPRSLVSHGSAVREPLAAIEAALAAVPTAPAALTDGAAQ